MQLKPIIVLTCISAIAIAHSVPKDVVRSTSLELEPLFHSNGVINLPKLESSLSTCDVVQDINEYKALQHSHDEPSSIELMFDLLFPLGPAGNALLATAYISGPPNLVLAFVPSSIDLSKLSYLVSFATGGLLGDVFLHLLPETFFGEPLEDKLSFVYVDERRNIILGLFIFVGFSLFFIIDKLLRILEHEPGSETSSGHSHSHSHATKASGVSEDKDTSSLRKRKQKSEDDDEKSTEDQPVVANPGLSIKTSAYLNLISDFTHNITDGLAIAASFYISRSVGATTTLAVFVHEFPHEMGDFALLIQGGFTKWQLMFSQFITAIGAFLGTFIGIWIETSISNIEVSTKLLQEVSSYTGIFNTSVTLGDLTLPFTAGGFLYIATVGVIPEVLELGEDTSRADEFKKFIGQLFFMGVGIGLMFFISWSH